MRILLIGDIVGKPGRQICTQAIRGLRAEERPRPGGGQRRKRRRRLGPHAGNLPRTDRRRRRLHHAGRSRLSPPRDLLDLADASATSSGRPTIRPTRPGRDFAMSADAATGAAWPSSRCWAGCSCRRSIAPSTAADRVLAALPADVRVILVDFHAEATSDKQLMGRHLDGRVSAVLGTHTHVPTADEQILPGGTAFQCDVGMTGPHESILGRRIDRVMETTPTFRPTHYDVATGDVRLQRHDRRRGSARPAGPRPSAASRSIRPPRSDFKGDVKTNSALMRPSWRCRVDIIWLLV